MRVVSADPTLADRLIVAVDPAAEPANWDRALATFLIKYVRSHQISTVDTAAAEPVAYLSPPQQESRSI